MEQSPKFNFGNFFPPLGYLTALGGGQDFEEDMNELIDENYLDDFENFYEGPEEFHGEEDEYDSHYGREDSESIDFSSYDHDFDRPYGKRLRQRRSLVDSFS